MIHSAKARSRRRSTQAGTAMIEGLMVNMIFILLFGGMVFWQATYSAKIMAMRAARSYAWTYALHGCDEVPENKTLLIPENTDTSGGVDSSDDSTSESDIYSQGGSTGTQGTGTELDNDPTFTNTVFGTGTQMAGSGSSENFGTVNASATIQMSSYNVVHMAGLKMSGDQHVQCNPTPADSRNMFTTVVQMARNLANW
jgi:hypothetical protein